MLWLWKLHNSVNLRLAHGIRHTRSHSYSQSYIQVHQLHSGQVGPSAQGVGSRTLPQMESIGILKRSSDS